MSGAPGDYSAAQVEFAERLRGSLQLDGVEVHRSGSTSKACPGPGRVAQRGYLCLYVTDESKLNFVLVHDPSTGEVGVSPEGMVVLAAFTDSGYAYGTYAVRSPKEAGAGRAPVGPRSASLHPELRQQLGPKEPRRHRRRGSFDLSARVSACGWEMN